MCISSFLPSGIIAWVGMLAGHIGFAVPDVEAACKRFEELGVAFVKKPNDGKMKNIAFIKDPDGYWIEILNAKHSRQFA